MQKKLKKKREKQKKPKKLQYWACEWCRNSQTEFYRK